MINYKFWNLIVGYDYADDVNITNKHNDDFIDYNDQDENRIGKKNKDNIY